MIIPLCWMKKYHLSLVWCKKKKFRGHSTTKIPLWDLVPNTRDDDIYFFFYINSIILCNGSLYSYLRKGLLLNRSDGCLWFATTNNIEGRGSFWRTYFCAFVVNKHVLKSLSHWRTHNFVPSSPVHSQCRGRSLRIFNFYSGLVFEKYAYFC